MIGHVDPDARAHKGHPVRLQVDVAVLYFGPGDHAVMAVAMVEAVGKSTTGVIRQPRGFTDISSLHTTHGGRTSSPPTAKPACCLAACERRLPQAVRD